MDDEPDPYDPYEDLEGLFEVLNVQQRALLDWASNSSQANTIYIVLAICLVLFAGCMSGLTLGLLSLDLVDLEVLKRSGNSQEKVWAEKILPVVSNSHFLLVTLLLCNAAAMEALPIVLDKIVHEVVAIIISVTAVLMFGEVIPQAICSKYGLQIGAALSYPVRFLMFITSPISYPLSKVLDWVLGAGHAVMMRRKQLKTLVALHSIDEGFGGKLSRDETQIIAGALDLTTKTAYHAMTPIEKVFMVSSTQRLDDITIESIMSSKPFSRLPVYEGEDKTKIIGLILVKELLEYVKRFPDSPVSSLKIRPIPKLSASTPMYDMLKLFRTGRSHLALLTQPDIPLVPEEGAINLTVSALSAQSSAPNPDQETESSSLLGPQPNARSDSLAHLQEMSTSAEGLPMYNRASAAAASSGCMASAPSAKPVNGLGSEGSLQASLQVVTPSPPPDKKKKKKKRKGWGLGSRSEAPASPPMRRNGSASKEMNAYGTPEAQDGDSAACEDKGLAPTFSLAGAGSIFGGGGSSLLRIRTHSDGTSTDDDDLDDLLPIPMIAKPGMPIGIITIEDVIEELMQFEIADETDTYIDNEQTQLVQDARLEEELPDNLKNILSMAEAVKVASLNRLPWSSVRNFPSHPNSHEPTTVTGAMASGAGKLTSLLTSILHAGPAPGISYGQHVLVDPDAVARGAQGGKPFPPTVPLSSQLLAEHHKAGSPPKMPSISSYPNIARLGATGQPIIISTNPRTPAVGSPPWGQRGSLQLTSGSPPSAHLSGSLPRESNLE